MNEQFEQAIKEESEIREILRKYLNIPMQRIDFLISCFKSWSPEDLFNLSLALSELKIWKEKHEG